MNEEAAGYQKAASGKPLALEARDGADDGRLFSPSIGRNRDAVREVFLAHMPTRGRLLEIASGTGEHGVHITDAGPGLHWTYSDIDKASLNSQAAWANIAPHDRLLGPLSVDTSAEHWGEAEDGGPWDAIYCANMIHIAPFEAGTGLIAGAGRLLQVGGRMMLYGPFARKGEIADSNARFSADLKRRDESWGVRDLDLEILPLAEQAGLQLVEVIEMPANNLSVVFEKT